MGRFARRDRVGAIARGGAELVLEPVLALALVALGAMLSGCPEAAQAPEHSTASVGERCDHGLGAARGVAPATSGPSPAPSKPVVAPAGWAPRIHARTPPGPAPTGMAWVPGGAFWMGVDDEAMPDAEPVHPVEVTGFWMDERPVTNAQFARFVGASHHVTVAERAPSAEQLPDALAEDLVAGSVVFTPPSTPIPLIDATRWWSYVAGASWRHPEGPGSTVAARLQHPVVQVAFEDAVAYCAWAHGRLPTEAEFEFAARGGLDRKRYAWGDELRPHGKPMANTFQGHFPDRDSGEDGYRGTSPVGSFPANGYGLADMAGNVWQWTSDWYRADTYAALAGRGVAVDPRGPADSLDPSEPEVPKRVQRGGSFLCTDAYCKRYVAGGRGKGAPDTGTSHVGFRCVRDATTAAPAR